MTAREEVTASAALYDWQALASPQTNELIFRRLSMVVFAQFASNGGLREASLRRMITPMMATEIDHVDWTTNVKVGRVASWFSQYGQSREEAAQLARRQARR